MDNIVHNIVILDTLDITHTLLDDLDSFLTEYGSYAFYLNSVIMMERLATQ